MKTVPKMKMTSKVKTTSKIKTTPKMKTTYDKDLEKEDNITFCLYSVSLGNALITAAVRPFWLICSE